MTVAERQNAIIGPAVRNRWMVLRRTDRELVLYRWESGLTRYEINIQLDPIGRVLCWSAWRNTRTSIDGDTGRRQRLEELLAS